MAEKRTDSDMMSELTMRVDAMVVGVICRSLGHTNWTYDDVIHRGSWKEYPDARVFCFDGEEKLLIHQPVRMLDGSLGQNVEYLFDKTDYTVVDDEDNT